MYTQLYLYYKFDSKNNLLFYKTLNFVIDPKWVDEEEHLLVASYSEFHDYCGDPYDTIIVFPIDIKQLLESKCFTIIIPDVLEYGYIPDPLNIEYSIDENTDRLRFIHKYKIETDPEIYSIKLIKTYPIPDAITKPKNNEVLESLIFENPERMTNLNPWG